jgi:hypothetical protein
LQSFYQNANKKASRHKGFIKMTTIKMKNALPALALCFGLAALSGCGHIDDNTHNCQGAAGENVSIEWGKFYATAQVTPTSGIGYEVTAMNRFMLASQHVNTLGGSCAAWAPQ